LTKTIARIASLADRLASLLDWWHSGKKVAVLEARVIGGGQSGKDTGEISTWNNHTYKRLESLYSAEKTTRIAASQKAALDFVETVVKEKRINWASPVRMRLCSLTALL